MSQRIVMYSDSRLGPWNLKGMKTSMLATANHWFFPWSAYTTESPRRNVVAFLPSHWVGWWMCLSDLCGSICKFGPLDFDIFLWRFMKCSDLYLMCILFSHWNHPDGNRIMWAIRVSLIFFLEFFFCASCVLLCQLISTGLGLYHIMFFCAYWLLTGRIGLTCRVGLQVLVCVRFFKTCMPGWHLFSIASLKTLLSPSLIAVPKYGAQRVCEVWSKMLIEAYTKYCK